MGIKYGSHTANFAIIEETRTVLADNFNLNPIVLATIIIFQGEFIGTALEAMNTGFAISTGSEYVDPILNRGGIQSMMSTFSLAFITLSLGGMMSGIGYMNVLVEKMVSRAKSVGMLSLSVVVTSFITSAMLGEVYLGLILNGNLYRDEFDRRGLSRSMLARLVPEGGLMLAPLVPWTTIGAFARTTLGVNGFGFAPYAFLNYLNPIISVLLSFMGLFIIYNKVGTKAENGVKE